MKATPLFSVDFGEEWFWSEVDGSTNSMELYNEINKSEKVTSYRHFLGKNLMLVQTRVKDETHWFLFDLKTNQGQKVHLGKRTNEIGMMPLRWDNGRLLMSISSDRVMPFVSQLGEDKAIFRQGTTLEEIEFSENPVLVWVKFKDF